MVVQNSANKDAGVQIDHNRGPRVFRIASSTSISGIFPTKTLIPPLLTSLPVATGAGVRKIAPARIETCKGWPGCRFNASRISLVRTIVCVESGVTFMGEVCHTGLGRAIKLQVD